MEGYYDRLMQLIEELEAAAMNLEDGCSNDSVADELELQQDTIKELVEGLRAEG